MHELTHLKFVLDARDAGKYELITSDEKNKEAFYEFAQVSIQKLRARGIAETDISNFVSSIRDGLISQLFNTPIDLFIEDHLYNQFEELRPYQFISLLGIIKESIRSVTDPQILEIASEDLTRQLYST